MQENNKQPNPLIEKSRAAIPGVVFRLPSRGKIYDEGVLDEGVEEGEVLVYPMRLKEELKMKSVDSILQGTAVSDSIKYCVPEVLDPLKLCPEDVDYLITTIKKMTHGSTFKFKDTCMKLEDHTNIPTPDNALSEMSEENRTSNIELPEDVSQDDSEGSENKADTQDAIKKENINNLGENSSVCEFNVSLDFFLNNAKELNIDEYKEKNALTLNGFNIEFHPITFEAFKELNTLNLKDQTKMDDEEYFNFINEFSNVNIARRIKKVDDISDPNIISEWVETLSLSDREKIFNKVAELQDWGIDFSYNIKCNTCGKTKKTDQSYINPLYFFLIY